jgi:uncharacterized Zn-binding protein involved in type VI secretion
MSKAIARINDELDGGTSTISGPSSDNVFINNKKAALKDDNTLPDVGKLNGSRNVIINNKSSQALGDSTDMGSIITKASDDVFVG